MDSIRYEEMDALYRRLTESSTVPDLILTTIKDLVFVFGQEQVDRWITDGTIQLLKKEEDHGDDTGDERLHDSDDEVYGK